MLCAAVVICSQVQRQKMWMTTTRAFVAGKKYTLSKVRTFLLTVLDFSKYFLSGHMADANHPASASPKTLICQQNVS